LTGGQVLKALVIRDDQGKFRDLEDVFKIARVQGKILFGTKQKVIRVLKILGPFPEIDNGYVVVIAGESEKRL
jgi:hypothetical protein